MNKYFKIEAAVDTHETGSAYPAVESYDDYDFKSQDSVYNLHSNTTPNFTPNIKFKLAKNAKLTDVLSQATISARGFLANKKFKDCLAENNIIPHICFPAYIEDHNSIIHDYYWIHFTWENSIQFLDFKNSKFKIKRVSKDLGEIDIDDYEDLKQKQGELGFIKMIHNYETTLLNPKYNLFIHPLNGTVFLSESLKFQLVELNISGISIVESDNLKVIESEI